MATTLLSRIPTPINLCVCIYMSIYTHAYTPLLLARTSLFIIRPEAGIGQIASSLEIIHKCSIELPAPQLIYTQAT